LPFTRGEQRELLEGAELRRFQLWWWTDLEETGHLL
jgi:hypothetical protein